MKNFEPKDLLFIDKMITPMFINVVYWILIAAVIIYGIGTMFAANFAVGLLGLVFGLIFARVYCEIMVVLFKIHANLQKIVDKDKE